jgi:hypothetical protein
MDTFLLARRCPMEHLIEMQTVVETSGTSRPLRNFSAAKSARRWFGRDGMGKCGSTYRLRPPQGHAARRDRHEEYSQRPKHDSGRLFGCFRLQPGRREALGRRPQNARGVCWRFSYCNSRNPDAVISALHPDRSAQPARPHATHAIAAAQKKREDGRHK